MALKIEVQPQAYRDISQLVEYFENKSSSAAEGMLDAIEHSISLIAQFPESAPKVAGAPGCRSRVVPKYRQLNIIYEFDDKRIYILTVWDSRQDPDKLNKRLI